MQEEGLRKRWKGVANAQVNKSRLLRSMMTADWSSMSEVSR